MMKKAIEPPIQSEDADDLFPYLPSEIMLNILSRIPTRTVMSCKCVCKAWRDLLETSEFVQSHLSKSVPGLAVYLRGENLKRYKIVEFVDEHRLNVVFSFDLPFISGKYIVHSSANGLDFMCNQYWLDNPSDLFVCNPITREYIRLPSPQEPSSRSKSYDTNICGFGVSRISGQYKVVRINCDFFGGFCDCQVYTVGSGSWRRIAYDDELWHQEDTVGAFLNGNLHWLAYKGSSPLICCLDLETECFSTFSPPPPCENSDYDYRVLSVLGDYLCVCDSSVESGRVLSVDIRLMKEYGDDKCWTDDEIRILAPWEFSDGDHCPIKVFKDGDMLMQWGSSTLYSYNSKLETVKEVDLFGDDPNIDAYFRTFATVYTPSFLSLETFTMENVSSF